VGTSVVALASSPTYAPSPATARRPAPLAAPESSHGATHWGKKQNILVSAHKTLISMCHSNDALIHKSHQQMSQRPSTIEESQHEMRTSMGFETPDLVIYPPLPPVAVEDTWAWYHNANGDEDDDVDMIDENSE
jgi:hypothetical protein